MNDPQLFLFAMTAVGICGYPLSLDALMADVDAARIDKRFKPIFKFLKKLTLTPFAQHVLRHRIGLEPASTRAE
jgi:hypothetical protein